MYWKQPYIYGPLLLTVLKGCLSRLSEKRGYSQNWKLKLGFPLPIDNTKKLPVVRLNPTFNECQNEFLWMAKTISQHHLTGYYSSVHLIKYSLLETLINCYCQRLGFQSKYNFLQFCCRQMYLKVSFFQSNA